MIFFISVRKQKVPELQIYDYGMGLTFVNADVAVPKHLMDKLLKIHENCLCQKTLGLNGETTFVALRLILIENYEDKNEPDIIKVGDDDHHISCRTY